MTVRCARCARRSTTTRPTTIATIGFYADEEGVESHVVQLFRRTTVRERDYFTHGGTCPPGPRMDFETATLGRDDGKPFKVKELDDNMGLVPTSRAVELPCRSCKARSSIAVSRLVRFARARLGSLLAVTIYVTSSGGLLTSV